MSGPFSFFQKVLKKSQVPWLAEDEKTFVLTLHPCACLTFEPQKKANDFVFSRINFIKFDLYLFFANFVTHPLFIKKSFRFDL